MTTLLTQCNTASDFDSTYIAVVKIDQNFLNRLKKYKEATAKIFSLDTVEPFYVSFSENQPDIYTLNSLCEVYPELKEGLENLEDTTDVISVETEISSDDMFNFNDGDDVLRVDLQEIHIYPNSDFLAFYAYGKYSGEKYWFEIPMDKFEINFEKENLNASNS